jgi:hypothetical protein
MMVPGLRAGAGSSVGRVECLCIRDQVKLGPLS